MAPAVVSITPINDIKDQNKIDHNLHQNVGPLTANHVHEEFSTVFHYSSPPFGKFNMIFFKCYYVM